MLRRILAMTALLTLFGAALALPAAAQEVCDIDPDTGDCYGAPIDDGDGDSVLPTGFADTALPILEKVADKRPGLPGGIDCDDFVTNPDNMEPGGDDFVMPGDNVRGGPPAFVTDPDNMVPGGGVAHSDDFITGFGTFAKQIVFGCETLE